MRCNMVNSINSAKTPTNQTHFQPISDKFCKANGAVGTFFLNHQTAFHRVDTINTCLMLFAIPAIITGNLPKWCTTTLLITHLFCRSAKEVGEINNKC